MWVAWVWMPFKIIDNTQHLQNCFGKAPNFNSSSYEKPNLSYFAKPPSILSYSLGSHSTNSLAKSTIHYPHPIFWSQYLKHTKSLPRCKHNKCASKGLWYSSFFKNTMKGATKTLILNYSIHIICITSFNLKLSQN
jgi:hypothetical protein